MKSSARIGAARRRARARVRLCHTRSWRDARAARRSGRWVVSCGEAKFTRIPTTAKTVNTNEDLRSPIQCVFMRSPGSKEILHSWRYGSIWLFAMFFFHLFQFYFAPLSPRSKSDRDNVSSKLESLASHLEGTGFRSVACSRVQS